MSPAGLAAKSGITEATISNWLNDKVLVDHVKASMLLKISDSLGVRPEWLLLGTGSPSHPRADSPSASQAVKHESLTMALQLVAETLEQKNLTLPAEKRAELTALVYDLLEEGMPEAKILRFVRAAA